MRKLLLSLSILFTSYLYAQQYSYSFNGVLSVETAAQIETRLLADSKISEVKIKRKEDREAGEIWFSLSAMESATETNEIFNPAVIKSLLIEYGLQPVDFKNRYETK